MLCLFLGTILSCIIWSPCANAQRRYVIGFMDLGSARQVDIMQSHLMLSTAGDAKFKVQLPVLKRPISLSLSGGGYYPFVVDPFQERARKDGKIEKAGIVVSSEQDICIHGLSFDYMTYGGFKAQPVTENSTSFYIPGYTIKSGKSQILVAGSSMTTKVVISFRNSTSGTYDKNITFTLNENEIFHVTDPKLDYTGTYVESNKPVGVFAGIDCGKVPPDVGFCDHMVVGVPPVSALGQNFVVTPLNGRDSYTGYVVRILSTSDNCSVETSTAKRVLDRGEFWEQNIVSSSEFIQIRCSMPCLVTQYSKGSKIDDTRWDPFMLAVPPVKDYSNKQIWTNGFDRHGLSMQSFANIVVPSGKEKGVLVDGKEIKNRWYEIPGSIYSMTSYPIYRGVHQAWHTDGVTKIGVITYGRGSKESVAYGYAACDAGKNFLNGEKEETSNKTVVDEEPVCGTDLQWIQECCIQQTIDKYANTGPSNSTKPSGSTAGQKSTPGSSLSNKDKEPDTAASCGGVVSSYNRRDPLLPLWFILCLLGGILLGVLFTVLIIWCRVRNKPGLSKYIFHPCAKDEAMIKMSDV